MAEQCPSCNAEIEGTAAFCASCGAALPNDGAPDAEAAPEGVDPGRACPACGNSIPNPNAEFCRSCGATLNERSGVGGLPVKMIAIGAAAVVGVVAIGIVAFVLFNGGGDSDQLERKNVTLFEDAESATVSDETIDTLLLAMESLPEPEGDTEAEMLHSLLGQPDVFVLEFDEPDDGGPIRRFETWYYLELGISYDFLDGVLLYGFPIEEPAPLTLIPVRFDPLEFTADTTLDDLRAMMFDADALIPEEPSEEYMTPFPVWAGEQIAAMFDTEGALIYVETIPLAAPVE